MIEYYCKGCLRTCTHNIAYRGGLISLTVISKCPCINCIVKMVCADRCEEFDIYIKTEIRELEEL